MSDIRTMPPIRKLPHDQGIKRDQRLDTTSTAHHFRPSVGMVSGVKENINRSNCMLDLCVLLRAEYDVGVIPGRFFECRSTL